MNIDTRPPPYSLRIDPEIRARLEAVAKAHNRSLHAEIIMRLLYTLGNPSYDESSASEYSKPLTAAQEERILEMINAAIDKRLKEKSIE